MVKKLLFVVIIIGVAQGVAQRVAQGWLTIRWYIKKCIICQINTKESTCSNAEAQMKVLEAARIHCFGLISGQIRWCSKEATNFGNWCSSWPKVISEDTKMSRAKGILQTNKEGRDTQ